MDVAQNYVVSDQEYERTTLIPVKRATLFLVLCIEAHGFPSLNLSWQMNDESQDE